jgi:hypothetical protein
MAIIVKCPPLKLDKHGRAVLEQKPFKGASAEKGEEVFIWTSHTKGGECLQMYGVVEASERQDNRLKVRVKIADRAPTSGMLIYGDLKEGKVDVPDGLADILVIHAPDKVAGLTSAQAAYLRSYFKPILLLHCVNMREYEGYEPDMYAGGFKYAALHGWGHEAFNFSVVNGRRYGHVEIMPRDMGNGPQPVSLRIENLGAAKGAAYAEGVLVVWTAPRRNGNGREVVGWYDNATVYRDRQEPKGSLKVARTFSPPGVTKPEICSYRVEAAAEDCQLLSREQRTLIIPSHAKGEKGVPGQMPAFYLSRQTSKKAELLIRKIRNFINFRRVSPKSTPARTGGGRQPDPERRKLIEATAIALVTSHFKQKLDYAVESVERDKVGYDLLAAKDDVTLCIEVKGRSGNEVSADFTINEYAKIKLHEAGDFPDGEYRICIVTDALDETKKGPQLHHFGWVHEGRKRGRWMRIDGNDQLVLEEMVAARGTME